MGRATRSDPGAVCARRGTFSAGIVVAVLHRVSGLVLFLAIGPAIYLLQLSLESESGYRKVVSLLDSGAAALLAALALCSLAFHLLAGARIVLGDCGIALSATAHRRASQALIVLAILVLLAMLWGRW